MDLEFGRRRTAKFLPDRPESTSRASCILQQVDNLVTFVFLVAASLLASIGGMNVREHKHTDVEEV
jgi:hypothetical protein